MPDTSTELGYALTSIFSLSMLGTSTAHTCLPVNEVVQRHPHVPCLKWRRKVPCQEGPRPCHHPLHIAPKVVKHVLKSRYPRGVVLCISIFCRAHASLYEAKLSESLFHRRCHTVILHFSRKMQGLNPEQLRAVMHEGSPLLIELKNIAESKRHMMDSVGKTSQDTVHITVDSVTPT